MLLSRGSSGREPKHRAHALRHQGGTALRRIVYIDSDLQTQKLISTLIIHETIFHLF